MRNQLLTCLFLFVFYHSVNAQNQKDFQTPPQSAKPRVWWHWMNGNITKEGIKKDLEWMVKTGIGGFQNFDASLMTPVMVKEKLSYMTAPWKDAFKYTTQLAKEKGLEMAIAGSPGWSVTGGPWVKPGDAMKKYVWTETIVEGGSTVDVTIKQPASVTGPMQNVPLDKGGFGAFEQNHQKEPEFYQDIAVIAYPISSKEQNIKLLQPKITSSGGNFTIDQLTDGDLTNFSYLEPKKIGEDTWISYEFQEKTNIFGVTFANEGYGELAVFNGGGNNRSIQYSEDGITFKELKKIQGIISSQVTIAFEPIAVKAIRLVYKTEAPANPGVAAMFGVKASKDPKGTNVSEFVIHTSPRINLFEGKAGFLAWKEDYNEKIPSINGPSSNEIIDLSSKLKSDGTLQWNAPAGKWAILRFGYSLTGKKNHPASPEATGLEVDKLDREAVSRYLNYYLDQYKDATGGLMGTAGLTHMVLDSYEAGHMTWTPSLPYEFKKRRGYDLTPFMPVLAGRVVNSSVDSEKFLWDFRKTIGELIVENHYEAIGDILAQRGMKRYTESHENGRIFLADGMDVKRKSNIPMSAMWQPGALADGTDEEIRSRADIRESASVAHIYGQNIVAAESMTTVGNSYQPHPSSLKRTADMEMASGLNRFVIHTSVHQPLDELVPGFALGPFGQWFTRQETWANQAKVWGDYLGRSSYLLQEGKNVADILYYYGENHNLTSLFSASLPKIPKGYEYDFVNSSALKDAIFVNNKRLTSKGGTTYEVLFLDASAQKMTLETLQRVFALAKAGAIIGGTLPQSSPSLADSKNSFNQIIQALIKLPNVHFNKDLASILQLKKLTNDVNIENNSAEILFQHRKNGAKEIYWLNSRSENDNFAHISFRVSGKTPKLWNPETGEISDISYEIKNGRTLIAYSFKPWDAIFIVFDGITKQARFIAPSWKITTSKSIETPWKVTFQKDRGAPAEMTMKTLISFDQHADPAIKYFSGEATYSNRFDINSFQKGEKIQLDLGDVKNLAEVYLNGKYVQTVWKKPFVVDITNQFNIGKNTLEVKVINSWVNRLVGDAQPGVKKITFIPMPLFRADSKTEAAGLLGPVKINSLK